MRNAKFNMNALVLVVLIFSVMGLFVTVKVPSLADHSAINEFYNIEGTDVSVKYSNLFPNGLYIGTKSDGELKLEGDFGNDWGAAVEGNTLYINEYTSTVLGMVLVRVDRIDLSTFERTVLLNDSILRGRCASGELVVMTGFMMPSTYPESNPLTDLYSMSSREIRHDGSFEVRFIDPKTGETVYSVVTEDAASSKFDTLYINRTLDEILKGGAAK